MMRPMRLKYVIAAGGVIGVAAALAGHAALVAAILIVLYVAWMFIRDARRRARGGWNRD